MISSLDEFSRARDAVVSCYAGLREQGSGPSHLPAVGMMIELPSVLEILDELVEAGDFFSIGTNDFVQYMLGADRTNRQVADYYFPGHPSVLRALHRIAQAVLASGKDLSVCGEMAREAPYIPFFLGIGIRKLSVDPQHLPGVRKTIARWSLADAQRYAARLLKASTLLETRRILETQAG
jgi:phosphotransferase system enzyme I (PtsP)